MRAQIHRGAAEIGGSCVELEASGKRLLLDLGLPLNTDVGDEPSLPEVAGLQDGDDSSLLGIVLTHAHPDHFGLIDSAAPGIPVFMGAATARILREAAFFTPIGLDRTPAGPLVDRQPLEVGPFTITPFLVDHSAFDAYSLLVEAGGRRLFYTGDFRAHGRKAGVHRRLLENPPKDIHALLLEGTTVGRPRRPDDSAPASEKAVEEQCAALFRRTPGLALACYSAQNVDRLVSIYKAARRADRSLIMDLYGATIAAATGRKAIPQGSWEQVRVYVPEAHRVKVKKRKEFSRVDRLGRSRIFSKEIAADPSRWVMSFRTSMAQELDKAGCLDGANAVWSMWAGYLEGERGERTRHVFEDRAIPLTVVHASGHAAVEDLQRFAGALHPDKVVPIHTDAPGRFASLFDRVEMHPDQEWWEI